MGSYMKAKPLLFLIDLLDASVLGMILEVALFCENLI